MILSAWPLLLSFPMLGIFIIRVVLGLVFLQLGYAITFTLARRESWIISTGWLALVTGLLLVIGLFTQVAALVAAILALIAIIIKMRAGHALEHNVSYYFLILAIALALLTLGPGTFALDLPL